MKNDNVVVNSSITLDGALFLSDDVSAGFSGLVGTLASSASGVVVVSHSADFVSKKISASTPKISTTTEGNVRTSASILKKNEGSVELLRTTVSTPSVHPSRSVNESYLHTFRRVAGSDFLEYGQYTRCDQLLEEWLEELGDKLGPVINFIFLKSLKDKQVALLLLKAVSNLPYEAVSPFGQVQAMAYLPMEDDELAEAGVRAFENWENRAGLDVLEIVQMREPWLERYRLKTIEYLKGF